MTSEKKILVLHGPNLNALGRREPGIYGTVSLQQIDKKLAARGKNRNFLVTCLQSNHEGELIDAVHGAHGVADAILLNPAGLTHTSVALLDAIKTLGIPTIEVHLTNLFSREVFRHVSVTGAGCTGVIMGFGAQSYFTALDVAMDLVEASE